MRQVARKGLLTVVATGGALVAAGGLAHADAGAAGVAAGSPGVGSGNAVQIPVHVPVNLCGDTVNVVGALNSALGTTCANESSGTEPDNESSGTGAAGAQGGGSVATGQTSGSAGVLSGNTAQVPVDVPVNACGLSVDVVGLLNPASGSGCANHEGTPVTPETPSTDTPDTPGTPDTPQAGSDETNTVAETGTRTAALAETGAEGLGLTAALAGALMLGGAVLYRRGRVSAGR